MSEQGQPQFVVSYGGRLYRVQAVAELDADDQQMLAMIEKAEEVGRAVLLPDLSYKSMTGPTTGADIHDQQQPMSGANIGDQDMAQAQAGANIGDQNIASPQSGANIGDEPDR